MHIIINCSLIMAHVGLAFYALANVFLANAFFLQSGGAGGKITFLLTLFDRRFIIYWIFQWITPFRWLRFDAALRIARIDAQLFNCIGAQHRLSMSQHFQNTFRHKRNRHWTRDEREQKKRGIQHWVESNSGFHFVHGLLKHRICTLEKFYTFFIFNWILVEAPSARKKHGATRIIAMHDAASVRPEKMLNQTKLRHCLPMHAYIFIWRALLLLIFPFSNWYSICYVYGTFHVTQSRLFCACRRHICDFFPGQPAPYAGGLFADAEGATKKKRSPNL